MAKSAASPVNQKSVQAPPPAPPPPPVAAEKSPEQAQDAEQPEQRGPGRPTNQEIKENPPEPARFTTIPVKALICPCCGKGMQPRVLDTRENVRTLTCCLCGGRFKATYEKNQPAMLRKL